MIAWTAGEAAAAKERLDHAVARPITLIAGAADRSNRIGAQAMRAVVQAALGDRAASEADAETVRSSPYAMPEALGRVEVARAIVLERMGDRAALQEHLERRRQLLDYVSPTDRAIVRALQRMLRFHATTVYRRPAPRAQAASRFAAMLSQVSPDAAQTLETAPAPEGDELELPASAREADASAVQAVERARAAATTASRPRKVRVLKVVVLWVLVVALFLVIWGLFSTPGAPPIPRPVPGPTPALEWFLRVVPVLLFAIFAVLVWEQRRNARTLRRATRDLALGRTAEATAVLRRLTKIRYKLTAAQAALQLAHVAERDGQLEAALGWCDLGLGGLTGPLLRAASVDILRPELIAERAYVLVALDRGAEAEAELAAIAREHPVYPYLPRTLYRVRMLQRIRSGDLAGAARIARGRAPELPLAARDDLLSDVVVAAQAGAEEEEARAHLRDELRRFPEGERWMQTVAPAALASLRAVPPPKT
jgi:hypothetical protein